MSIEDREVKPYNTSNPNPDPPNPRLEATFAAIDSMLAIAVGGDMGEQPTLDGSGGNPNSNPNQYCNDRQTDGQT